MTFLKFSPSSLDTFVFTKGPFRNADINALIYSVISLQLKNLRGEKI